MENIKLTNVWGWLRQLASTQDEEVVKTSEESVVEVAETQVNEPEELIETPKLDNLMETPEVVDLPEPKPEPRHLSNKVIFLSFDGVLASGYYNYMMKCRRQPMEDGYGKLFDPECVNWLKKILDETGADIIVTSNWKEHLRLKDFQNMWEMRKLPGTIVDVTPIDERCGDEIALWLSDCSDVVQYIILDNSPVEHFNDDQLNHLIRLNPNDGVNRNVARKAIEMLNL